MTKVTVHRYTKNEHNLDKSAISSSSLKVIKRLKEKGYEAFLVGGGVRDLLLGHRPKDFDITTNAKPEEIRAIFRNSRIIGRRFRIVHILFGRDIIEVSTFRASPQKQSSLSPSHHSFIQQDETGFLVRDNLYGSQEEDAFRRDFTINALYYDPEEEILVDFCQGVEDLQKGRLTLIGEPQERFREDPVRILRALRFEAKLSFSMADELKEALVTYAPLLDEVSPSRLYDEVIKLFLTGHGVKTLETFTKYHLLSYLFPNIAEIFSRDNKAYHFLKVALNNSDIRIKEGRGSSPYFLYASLLWADFEVRLHRYKAEGLLEFEAIKEASDGLFLEMREKINFPRYIRELVIELWTFQSRLTANRLRRLKWLLTHKRFKPAYDFLLLRAEAEESPFIIERAAFLQERFAAIEKVSLGSEVETNERGKRRPKRESRRNNRKK